MNNRTALVGDTGFVGSNLLNSHTFKWYAHSTNVKELYGLKPELLVYTGVTGTKWWANQHSEEDTEIINAAIKNIKEIEPQKLILISTIDVYDNLNGMDEDKEPNKNKLHIYGRHRLELERWVESEIEDYHIIRLPAIYGNNLKKNFVYDLINLIPSIIDGEIIQKLKKTMPEIEKYYIHTQENYFKLKSLSNYEYRTLRYQFIQNDINALIFTNHESEYQFYNLKYLWEDILKIIENDIPKINIVTEPIMASELYKTIYNSGFKNDKAHKIV